MAVVTVKSTSITNRDATPAVASNSNISRARLQSAIGEAVVTNGDSIASKVILTSVPSNARVSQVILSCGAITSAAADVGLYQTTDNGGAVVDADFFASAQSIATALSNTDITRESGVFSVANAELPLWQALSLTADPQRDYDVVATLTAAATATASLAVEVRYVQ